MKINFWDCPHSDYDEIWNGEDEARLYMCNHPNGDGSCDLENKWCNKKAECPLVDNCLRDN